MSTRRSLSIYRIKDAINGDTVTDFNDVVQSPGTLTIYNLPDDAGIEARLFIDKPAESTPTWLSFLEEGFGEIEEIGKSVSFRAVLVLRINPPNPIYFAIPFGSGRFLLKPGSFERNYGLKVALNSIYARPDSGVLDPSRIRSIDIKTVAANTLHTRRQANRRANFEVFGVNTDRDLLKRITGKPLDDEKWGTRVTGADSVQINPSISFEDLGNTLEAVEVTFKLPVYSDYFSWIDNVRVVTDPILQEKLREKLVNLLKAGQIEKLEMAPPELVDYDAIESFYFHPWSEKKFLSLSLSDFLNLLEEEDRLDGLTIPLLKTFRVVALDHGGEELNRWNAFNCICGEFTNPNNTYLVEDGEFYQIAADYLDNLNDFIASIPECDLELFEPTGPMTEDVYNERASRDDNMLCLDRKTVRMTHRTSPVEICDILTDKGHYIHVKRKLDSSSLSHLFNQGYVSGELLFAAPEYRDAVSDKIEEVELQKFTNVANRFQAAVPTPFSARSLEIVYCVIAQWNHRPFEEAIPFFSKINLRRAYEDLTRIGYKVSVSAIQGD